MIQNKIVPFDQLPQAYLDRGLYFGDGVYEVIRSYDGKIFMLDAHLKRFAQSLKGIGIKGVHINDVRSRVVRAFDEADISDAKIYFHITRGSELRSHAGSEKLKPNFFLTVTEVGDFTDEKKNGIAVSTHPDWRWKRCDIKSLNLLPNVLARMDAESKGCQEAIFVDDDGLITEGSHSAFFMIIAEEKRLLTRPLGPEILPSITRQVVLEIAERVGLSVLEKAIRPWHADWADELFIAVTTKDIVPVVKFDGETIGDGRPGLYTRKLMKEFMKQVTQKNKKAE